MKRLIALCVTAGALAIAAPALADPGYSTTLNPAFDVVTMPVQMVAAPPGVLMEPESGAVGTITGTLVPANPHCGVMTDFNGKHTTMCGP